jgi:hypothetical protein
MKELTPQTKWTKYSFDEIKDLAEDDDIIIRNEDELLNYLKERRDNFVECLGDNQYDVLFA